MTEWNAAGYEQVSALQKQLADDALASLLLKGTERILDIGCGDGRITAEVAQRVAQGSVLGLDPSRNMIAYAQQRFAPAQYPNLRYTAGDARALNFMAEFDLVISFNALHWVHEQVTALKGICAALKPRGQTLLRFVPRGARPNLEAIIEETAHTPRWASYFAGVPAPYAHFTPDEYRALAQSAGLRVIDISLLDSSWDFKQSAGFKAWARVTFVEWTRHLPKDDVDAFIDDSLARYARLIGDDHTFKFYQMTSVLTPNG
jgi:trans-aconitate methyltransferase